MEIRTSRFGVVTVDEDRLMTFPRGLLGFPDHTRFALIQTGHGNYFFWLQSVDEPSVAFVVTDPNTFFKEYDVPLRKETFEDLAFTDMKFAQILVICNKVGEWLTGNLLGPIVVNGENRVRISVMDNGVGIPPENLDRIFNHGFTTRKDGHGFGLHSGALAAKELGGGLAAHSDGPGTGARFVLDLPLQPPKKS